MSRLATGWRLVLVSAWLSAPAGVVCAGQAPEPVATVRLQEVSAVAGRDLTVPVAIEVRESIEVASLEFTVMVPAALEFRSAVASYAFRELKGSISATRAAGTPGRLLVRVKAGATPLLTGTLGYLVFLVAPATPLGAVHVEATGLEARDPRGRPIAPVTVVTGRMAVVDAQDAVVPACFFYIH